MIILYKLEQFNYFCSKLSTFFWIRHVSSVSLGRIISVTYCLTFFLSSPFAISGIGGNLNIYKLPLEYLLKSLRRPAIYINFGVLYRLVLRSNTFFSKSKSLVALDQVIYYWGTPVEGYQQPKGSLLTSKTAGTEVLSPCMKLYGWGYISIQLKLPLYRF